MVPYVQGLTKSTNYQRCSQHGTVCTRVNKINSDDNDNTQRLNQTANGMYAVKVRHAYKQDFIFYAWHFRKIFTTTTVEGPLQVKNKNVLLPVWLANGNRSACSYAEGTGENYDHMMNRK